MKRISLFLALVLNTSAFAATITVTNINDTGAGSLRAAITAAANGDAITFSNTTAGGTTNFYDGVQRIITLGSALPNLSQNISVTGPGAGVVTVRRNPAGATPAFRIFTISNGTATGPTVSISGLTITNGNLTGNVAPDSCGAGILNDRGTLTLDSVIVSGNTTTRDGGGIYSYGRAASATLHVVRSSVTSNNADWGGGIYNDGYQGAATLTVRLSTVSSNTVTGIAGGILNVGAGGGSASATILTSTVGNNSAYIGGGIENVIGSLTVTNCTLSGNSSGRTSGAIYNGSGGNAGNTTLLVTNSTLTNNSAPMGGGCLFNEDGTSTATIRNSILQVGSAGGTLANNGGTITSQGYNLSSDNGGGFLIATGDKINTNPLLGPLQDNGGPTQTHALLSGSPAIDAGRNTVAPTVDQRGAARPVDGDNNGSSFADIGAVEFGSTPNGSDFVVNTLSPFGQGSGCDAAHCRLDEAMEEANSLGGSNTITFLPAAFSVATTAALDGPLPNISNDMTIRGPGARLLTFERYDGASTPEFRIFNIPGGGLNVAISGLTIRNGRVSGSPAFGGGIFSASALTLTDCVIADNQAGAGGGVALDNSRGLFSGCTFSNNLASSQGGAINYAGNNATLTLLNCTISGNTAQGGNGGGILNVSFSGTSTLQASNCTIVQNTAGGGILTNGIGSGASAKSFLSNTIIANNAATNLRAVASNGGTAAIMSDGYNLTSDNGGGFLTATGDQINTNPLLGPLQDNGGPTPTHALLLGSPAINSAHTSSLTTDQRGLLRQFGSAVDKGAYELQPESYAFWASYSFPPDASPALSAADADYDGDGIRNGLEQALGRDPLVADAGLALQLAVSSGYLVLQFERSIAVDPAKVFAEQSLTLQPQSWTRSGIVYQVLGPASTTTELVQALIPISGAPKKFGRLRYTP